jgi:hypothetical protein
MLGSPTGCARYEYQLVQPQHFAGHIGRDDFEVKLDPLAYRFNAIDNRLVVRIENPTNDKIQLRGNESYVVDPQGQSHSLRSISIAPRSWVKLIVPPPRPVVYDTGPTFGVGFGTRIGMNDDRHDVEPLDDRPRFLAIYDDDESYYWDLKGEGEMRIRFSYERSGKAFDDDFVLRRVRM